jgi:hypothetical protein
LPYRPVEAIANIDMIDQPPVRHHHLRPRQSIPLLHQHHPRPQPLAQQVPCRSVSLVPSSPVSRLSCSKRAIAMSAASLVFDNSWSAKSVIDTSSHCTDSINWVANAVGFIQLQK